MKVLLSIKPEFVQRIMSGEKRFEYRRILFKRPVESVIVYSTMPEGRIVGELRIGAILHDRVEALWERTRHQSGISLELFQRYFSDKEVGYALEIEEVIPYNKPIDPREVVDEFRAPQSFRYVGEEELLGALG